jgi:hypothetical protein
MENNKYSTTINNTQDESSDGVEIIGCRTAHRSKQN